MYQFELKNEATFIENHTQLLPTLMIVTPVPVIVGPAFAMGGPPIGIGDRKRDRLFNKIQLKENSNMSTLSLSELLEIHHKTCHND